MAATAYNCECGGFFIPVKGMVRQCPKTGNQLRRHVCSKCAGQIDLTPINETHYTCESCGHEGVNRELAKGGVPDIPVAMKPGEVMYFDGIDYGGDS